MKQPMMICLLFTILLSACQSPPPLDITEGGGLPTSALVENPTATRVPTLTPTSFQSPTATPITIADPTATTISELLRASPTPLSTITVTVTLTPTFAGGDDTMPDLSLSSVQQKLVEQAKSVLSNLSAVSIAANDIQLVDMKSREWSDTSLGCPQEGMMYAQMLTSGYVITLEAQSSQYEFHTDTADKVVLCQVDGKDAKDVLK